MSCHVQSNKRFFPQHFDVGHPKDMERVKGFTTSNGYRSGQTNINLVSGLRYANPEEVPDAGLQVQTTSQYQSALTGAGGSTNLSMKTPLFKRGGGAFHTRNNGMVNSTLQRKNGALTRFPSAADNWRTARDRKPHTAGMNALQRRG